MAFSRKAAFAGIFLMLLHWSSDYALAKKKDFKGLFGSYRREKFTENEGNASDVGMDIMLSTLYPLTSFANTTTTPTTDLGAPMPGTISFNVELNFYKTWNYNLLTYLSIGHYAYDSRSPVANQPATEGGGTAVLYTQYNLLDMRIIPVMAGVKYRFGRSDFVPYIGAGAGVSFITRDITYNYSNLTHTDSSTPLTFQASGGFEFFFAPGAGLRIELGAWMALLGSSTKNTNSVLVESIVYPENPLAIRYASGIFFLF